MRSRNFVAVIAMALCGCGFLVVVEPHPIDVSNGDKRDAPYSQRRKIAGHFAIVFDDSIKRRANFERQFAPFQFHPKPSKPNWTMKWSSEEAVVTSFRQLFSGLFERTTDYASVPSPTIMQQQALRGVIVVELTQFDDTFEIRRISSFPIKYEITGTTKASFRISVSGVRGDPIEIVASAVGTATDTYNNLSIDNMFTDMFDYPSPHTSSNVARASSRSIEKAIRLVLLQVSKQISESPDLQSTAAN